MYPFRVFVSYAHKDRILAEKVIQLLRKRGLMSMSDRAIKPGRPFSEKIKFMISCSHIFVPLLTRDSANRPWVHQETGYAVAQDVPILPIAVRGEVPQAMIADLHAFETNRGLTGFSSCFSSHHLFELVLSHADPRQPYLNCMRNRTARSEYIGQHAAKVRDLLSQPSYRLGLGRVFEQATLSTFSIPDKPPRHPIWTDYEGQVPRTVEYREALGRQRMELEWLARRYGCDIVISPSFPLGEKGPVARRTRLGLLTKFLKDRRVRDVRVKVLEKARRTNVLIVGDWFIVESQSRGQRIGFEESYCAWHAPYVLKRLMDLRREYFRWRAPPWSLRPLRADQRFCRHSRERATATIQQILASLPR